MSEAPTISSTANLQNKPKQVQRDEHGRLVKGFTANPGGRPKQYGEFLAYLKSNDKEVWAKLIEACRDGDMRAIEVTLAYMYGKPKQSLDIGGEAIGNIFNAITALIAGKAHTTDAD